MATENRLAAAGREIRSMALKRKRAVTEDAEDPFAPGSGRKHELGKMKPRCPIMRYPKPVVHISLRSTVPR